MPSYNRVVLVGHLTRDPETRYTKSQTAVCNASLAINDRRKSPSGEWQEETTFVDVTLWARTAEICAEYCSKGSAIMIEGRLQLDTWETDGQKRSKLRVIGERLVMLGRAGDNAARDRGSDLAPKSAAMHAEDEDGEVPF